MSENTVQNNNNIVVFEDVISNEDGELKIPHDKRYKHQIEFDGKDCIVIPLEGVKLKNRPKSQRKVEDTKSNKKEETGRDE